MHRFACFQSQHRYRRLKIAWCSGQLPETPSMLPPPRLHWALTIAPPVLALPEQRGRSWWPMFMHPVVKEKSQLRLWPYLYSGRGSHCWHLYVCAHWRRSRTSSGTSPASSQGKDYHSWHMHIPRKKQKEFSSVAPIRMATTSSLTKACKLRKKWNKYKNAAPNSVVKNTSK